MTQDFDKILTDARGIKKTLLKLDEAEVKITFAKLLLQKNQEEIEELIESTLQLGNVLIEKVEDFKQKSQNPEMLRKATFLDVTLEEQSEEDRSYSYNNTISFRSSSINY